MSSSGTQSGMIENEIEKEKKSERQHRITVDEVARADCRIAPTLEMAKSILDEMKKIDSEVKQRKQ